MDIQTKANVDDTIFFLDKNKVKVATVHEIQIKIYSPQIPEIKYKTKFRGVVESPWRNEGNVFLTREALIKNLETCEDGSLIIINPLFFES